MTYEDKVKRKRESERRFGHFCGGWFAGIFVSLWLLHLFFTQDLWMMPVSFLFGVLFGYVFMWWQDKGYWLFVLWWYR